AGDVCFHRHVVGDPAMIAGFPPQAVEISARAGLYVKDGATGTVHTIVREGGVDPASDAINSRGDVAFVGFTGSDANPTWGIFLYSGGTVKTIAKPGDSMPGGAH